MIANDTHTCSQPESYYMQQPPGGVAQGEQFVVSIDAKNYNDPHNVPIGVWRDDICGCCNHGCCHPMCCLGTWCTPCALGQVMSRIGLNKVGLPSASASCMSTFKFLLLLTTVKIIVDNVLSVIIAPLNNSNDDNDFYIYSSNNTSIYNSSTSGASPAAIALSWIRAVLTLAFYLYVLILIIRTRSYIRAQYRIPEGCCGCCEDCCCAFWCHCCTVLQMARHTADYRQHKAACCSDDGLVDSAH